MDLANIKEATEWFEVLQTSKRTQTAMMTLAPGDATGRKAEAREKRSGFADALGQTFRHRLTGNGESETG